MRGEKGVRVIGNLGKELPIRARPFYKFLWGLAPYSRNIFAVHARTYSPQNTVGRRYETTQILSLLGILEVDDPK